MKGLRIVWSHLWRSLVVGTVYVATLVLTGMMAGMLGWAAPASNADNGVLLGLVLASGFLLSLVLGPLATRLRVTRRLHILVWTTVIFLNLTSVAIEGTYFAPDLVSLPLPVLVGQQLLAALAAAGLIAVLYAPGAEKPLRKVSAPSGSWQRWAGGLLLGSAVYIVSYGVFGMINYALITGPYYASHASGLTVPGPVQVWLVESIRAPLIVLSVVPFVWVFSTGRRQLALLTGFLLFWVGGVVPLLMQALMLPPVLLVASAAEIFCQNFLTGIAVALIFSSEAGRLARSLGPPSLGKI